MSGSFSDPIIIYLIYFKNSHCTLLAKHGGTNNVLQYIQYTHCKRENFVNLC